MSRISRCADLAYMAVSSLCQKISVTVSRVMTKDGPSGYIVCNVICNANVIYRRFDVISLKGTGYIW